MTSAQRNRPDAEARLVHLVFRLSTKERFDGFEVGSVLTDGPGAPLRAKVRDALALIAQCAPETYRRLRRDLRRILIADWGKTHVAQYFQSNGICRICADWLTEQTSMPRIAATLVHEGMHARLFRLGFGYSPPIRSRIEAICFRAELAFVRRLPEDEITLVQALERQLARPASDWSDDAFRERGEAAIRKMGLPEWQITVIRWVAKLFVAVTSSKW